MAIAAATMARIDQNFRIRGGFGTARIKALDDDDEVRVADAVVSHIPAFLYSQIIFPIPLWRQVFEVGILLWIKLFRIQSGLRVVPVQGGDVMVSMFGREFTFLGMGGVTDD